MSASASGCAYWARPSCHFLACSINTALLASCPGVIPSTFHSSSFPSPSNLFDSPADGQRPQTLGPRLSDGRLIPVLAASQSCLSSSHRRVALGPRSVDLSANTSCLDFATPPVLPSQTLVTGRLDLTDKLPSGQFSVGCRAARLAAIMASTPY